MIIKNVELETVCGITSKLPDNQLCEIAFAGKSNVGKSSLINGLVNRRSHSREKMAYHSVGKIKTKWNTPVKNGNTIRKRSREKWSGKYGNSTWGYLLCRLAAGGRLGTGRCAAGAHHTERCWKQTQSDGHLRGNHIADE